MELVIGVVGMVVLAGAYVALGLADRGEGPCAGCGAGDLPDGGCGACAVGDREEPGTEARFERERRTRSGRR